MTARMALRLHAVSVRRGDKWVLRDISWQLRPGERWALLGRQRRRQDAAAQTAERRRLADALRARHPHAPMTQLSRRPTAHRAHRGQGAHCLRRRRAARQVRALWLEPARAGCGRHGAAWHRSIAQAGHRAGRRAGERDAARAAVCTACAAREFLTLSYGEKRLALLARALVHEPDWLLLDEFYNGLDLGYRQRIDVVLGRGAPPRPVLGCHGASRHGRTARNTLPDGTRRAGGCMRSNACCRRISNAWRRWRVKPGGAHRVRRRASHCARRYARRYARRHRGRRGAVLLRLSHVDLYVEYRPVLQDLNWQLRRGEHWAVFGANGAGKSSFLKLLYGDLAPALGRTHRARRVSARHAHQRMEAARGLRLAGTAEPITRSMSACWSWLRAAAMPASACRCADRGESHGCAHWLQILRAAAVRRSAGRASCRMGSCAAR